MKFLVELNWFNSFPIVTIPWIGDTPRSISCRTNLIYDC